jgi:hypothetical protein
MAGIERMSLHEEASMAAKSKKKAKNKTGAKRRKLKFSLQLQGETFLSLFRVQWSQLLHGSQFTDAITVAIPDDIGCLFWHCKLPPPIAVGILG